MELSYHQPIFIQLADSHLVFSTSGPGARYWVPQQKRQTQLQSNPQSDTTELSCLLCTYKLQVSFVQTLYIYKRVSSILGGWTAS